MASFGIGEPPFAQPKVWLGWVQGGAYTNDASAARIRAEKPVNWGPPFKASRYLGGLARERPAGAER
ncbi:MAG: hypothetical protein N3C12_14620 [Candidatus Binatia bacterium]|nr:hypothetical protein [Candidatus Binatia bacterium]